MTRPLFVDARPSVPATVPLFLDARASVPGTVPLFLDAKPTVPLVNARRLPDARLLMVLADVPAASRTRG